MKLLASSTRLTMRIPPICVSKDGSSEVTACIFGNASSSTHIVLFGDSHAIQWAKPLERIAIDKGWKMTTILKLSCPAADVSIPEKNTRLVRECNEWRTEALRHIITQHPSLVFVVNSMGYLEEADRNGKGLTLAQWQEGVTKTLHALNGAGLTVAWLRDNPRAKTNISVCIARSVSHSWYSSAACEMKREDVLRPAIYEAEQSAAYGLKNIHFIDMTDYYCNKDICAVFSRGGLMYQDNNHLTHHFIESLAPVIGAKLIDIITPHKPSHAYDVPSTF
jgi:hypothetical protein